MRMGEKKILAIGRVSFFLSFFQLVAKSINPLDNFFSISIQFHPRSINSSLAESSRDLGAFSRDCIRQRLHSSVLYQREWIVSVFLACFSLPRVILLYLFCTWIPFSFVFFSRLLRNGRARWMAEIGNWMADATIILYLSFRHCVAIFY